jgi:arylsulfatase A-like enzyme
MGVCVEPNRRALVAAVLTTLFLALFVAGCSSGPPEGTTGIRLVDRFTSKAVTGSPSSRASDSAVSWNFSRPVESGDALQGWKAGPGVAELKLVDGKLSGRATTAFPLIYAPITQTVDAQDEFHSMDVRLRASADGDLIVIRSSADALNLERIVQQNQTGTPQLSARVTAGDALQTLTIPSRQPSKMGGTKYLLMRPVSISGATFEIESVRMVSQKEHRESVPSGVGWQGLGSIFHETIVSRSPETVSFDVDLPANSWLDLNIGTPEPGPVTFRVTAIQGGQERTLLERTVTTPHRWDPAPIDLAGLSGPATLRFSLAVEQERLSGFWGSPVIRFRHPPLASAHPNALGGAAPPRRVIFMMCDTLRKDHLGVYGYGRETAPRLAHIASEGTLFLDNVAQATWTKASTPSLMTSLYPTSTRVQGVPDRLSPAATTLAEVFRDAGYATVAYSSVAFTGRLTNLHQGFEEMHESSSLDDPKYRGKTARSYVDRAGDWIERHPDTPFFMYLHVFDPHHPYEPRAPYDSTYVDPAGREGHEKERELSKKFIAEESMRGRGLPKPAELEKAGIDSAKWLTYESGWYDGSILGMDAELGRLLQRLRGLGMLEDTLFVFFGDHGESFGDHGQVWHGHSVYGDLAGVPMLFYRPGVIPAGLKISETVRNLDLMPTVLDLSGLPIPEKVQGQSLVPLMAAARQAQVGSPETVPEIAATLGWTPQPAVTEKSMDPEGERPRDLESYGIVLDGWKLVHNPHRGDSRPEFELYNHKDDPLNTKNVIDQHSDIAESLKAKLAEWHEMVERDKLPEGESLKDLPDEELQRLKSLGYVQ